MTVNSGSATVTLPTDDQILITREFDAPKHLVYRAWTTPELIRQWWAGHRGEVTVVEIDLRVGGRWRYVLIANAGQEVGFNGEFREIVPDERIVSTEVYEAMPDGDPVVNTVTFSEADGRTTLKLLVQAPSKEVRDAIVNSGMEVGLQEQMDIIDGIVASLR
jgi:uncharacterized protein YndB with AHSA1/START domain